MKQALVDQIVDAVLYEGYILYPYRPSVKNRQRWTFGGLYPRAYCEAQGSGDAWSMQTECLVRGTEDTTVDVQVRFLHLQARLVGQLDCPFSESEKPLSPASGERDWGEGARLSQAKPPHPQPLSPEYRGEGRSCRIDSEWAAGEEPAFHVVEKLKVGDRLLQTWQEALQRDVVLKELDLASLACKPRHTEFAFPASRKIEAIPGPAGTIEAILVREQKSVTGRVQVSAEPIGEGLFKLLVRIENHTTLESVDQRCRDQAVLHALASTHTILGVQNGAFVSLIDPPDECRALAAACHNEGTWPVLVGREGDKDTMLSSPITLYDYPQIAAESPGDFFDGTEIDEMLVLRILTLTDEERQAVAAVDERARALLTRTKLLTEEQIMGLHGTVRGLRPASSGESP